jgi:hypothetical protein
MRTTSSVSTTLAGANRLARSVLVLPPSTTDKPLRAPVGFLFTTL